MSATPTTPMDAVKTKKERIKLQQDWIYECNKLNKRYNVIEKQSESIYRDGNPLSLEFKDIFDWKQLMHSERIKIKRDLHKHLSTTSNLVHKFELVVSNITTNANDQFLYRMNAVADQIEDELMKFNTNHENRLKELENAENIIWRELCMTTDKIHTFEKDAAIIPEHVQKTPTFAKKRTLNKHKFASNEHDSRPQKLIDIQKQIDEYGRYGGWPRRDHDDFLKLYQQIPSDKQLLHQLSEVMPQYTLSELREHLIWFDQYERLWDHKREIIKEWKAEKMQQKEFKNKLVSKHTDKIEKVKQRKQQHIKCEQEEKKKMIKEWREQKEAEDMEQTRLKNEALLRKKLKKQQLYKQRVKEQKKLLAELSEKKKLNKLVQNAAKPNKNLRSIKNSERNKELLIKFRTKDMLLVSKKKEAINKKQKEEREREWRMVNLIAKSQPDIKIKTDKQRLLKMTQTAKKRNELKSREKSKGSSNDKGRMLMCAENATRAVPSWRRGL